jgi:hypothetical protein
MHTRTENLLSTRDARRREALRALPELAPPQGAWDTIRAAAEAARLASAARSARRRRVLILAAASLVAALALNWHRFVPRAPVAGSDPGLAQTASAEFSTPQAPAAAPVSAAATDYIALLAESARLERLLLELPRGGQVMNASTAGTIVGLEDQVAYIDERLTMAAASRSRNEYRQALWRERVDVMNALVQVRYAQAQSVGY